MSGVRWSGGAPDVRERVEGWLAEPAAGELLRDNGRRALVRLRAARDGGEGDLLVKRFRVRSAEHRWRERAKAALGGGPVAREARSLAAAHDAGVPVPEPLGRGRAGGDALLVLRFLEGTPLRKALARSAPPSERRALLRALGRAVAALHAAGWTHGDLHVGNVWVTAAGPVLLDLQRARRTTSARARRADLAALDFSLWPHASAADRLRVRLAALGLGSAREEPDAEARVRAVGRAAWARARRHWRSRDRHARRAGRRFTALRAEGARGLCLRSFGETAAREALAAHGASVAGGGRPRSGGTVLERKRENAVSAVRGGGRAVVVKTVARRGARGWARAAADLVRGSPARRAWRAGYGLEARGVRAARPLAYVEERRLGLPLRSAIVLEDLRPARPATEVDPDFADGRRVVHALASLALSLHRLGVDHGDLKASHVFLHRDRPDLAPTLIDLDGVRFRPPGRLGDARRVRALVQLNASLADELCPAENRCRAFRRYAALLPFADEDVDAVLARVVRESLARGHHWKGVGCERAERIRRA